ncbi:MAG: 6,7-dimethyl-8-ribityllumazine synthase [Nitrospinae bacterium RIFCSPLOWO2_12_FULL_45_22]|nr:MAG: 6,7-dimethyl-8-ribityllumazine synthase [Nitrospinae bacterium RIFCSPLOWO2_12_FULL_45_22]
MPRIFQGFLRGEGFKFGIIVSRFNDFITSRLLEGCLDALKRNGVRDDDIDIFKVPGSFEIPYVAKKLALGKRYDSVICLGTIIRGATPHYEYIAAEVTKGIANTALETGVPIILGVLTTENIEQAIERAGTKIGNKGWDAAIAALEMVNLYREMGSE